MSSRLKMCSKILFWIGDYENCRSMFRSSLKLSHTEWSEICIEIENFSRARDIIKRYFLPNAIMRESQNCNKICNFHELIATKNAYFFYFAYGNRKLDNFSGFLCTQLSLCTTCKMVCEHDLIMVISGVHTQLVIRRIQYNVSCWRSCDCMQINRLILMQNSTMLHWLFLFLVRNRKWDLYAEASRQEENHRWDLSGMH